MKALFFFIVLHFTVTSYAQNVGNLYDFDFSSYNHSQVVSVEWVSNEIMIAAVSKSWYVDVDFQSELAIIDKSGTLLLKKRIAEINGIEDQTILHFQCNPSKDHCLLITRNEINDSLSQNNLMLLETDLTLVKDTSFLNPVGEKIYLVNGKYDEQRQAFYGCGISKDEPYQVSKSEFYFNYSISDNNDIVYVENRGSINNSTYIKDIVKHKQGYFALGSTGKIKKLDEYFGLETEYIFEQSGIGNEGENIEIINDTIYVFSNASFEGNKSNSGTSTISKFSLQGEYLEDEFVFVDEPHFMPALRQSMVYKNDNFYLGMMDIYWGYDFTKDLKRMKVEKYDRQLNRQWVIDIDSEDEWHNVPIGLAVNDQGEIILYGRTFSTTPNYSHYYPFLYLIDEYGELVNTIDFEKVLYQPIIYPNPSIGIVNIKGIPDRTPYKLYALNGSLIQEDILTDHQIYIRDAGEYIIKFFNEEKNVDCKIIVVK